MHADAIAMATRYRGVAQELQGCGASLQDQLAVRILHVESLIEKYRMTPAEVAQYLLQPLEQIEEIVAALQRHGKLPQTS